MLIDHDQEEANKTYAEMIVSLFKKYTTDKVRFFQGGSRRFGWVTKYSDWDYFVYIHPNIRVIVIKALAMFGIKEVKNDYSHVGSLYGNESETIHVCIFNDQDEWRMARDEHIKVEEWLKDKPLIVEYIKQVKFMGIKGNVLYKSLTNQMKGYDADKPLWPKAKGDVPF